MALLMCLSALMDGGQNAQHLARFNLKWIEPFMKASVVRLTTKLVKSESDPSLYRFQWTYMRFEPVSVRAECVPVFSSTMTTTEV